MRLGTALSGFVLLLLGQACGGRYEIGELEPPLGGLEPPPGEDSTGAEGIVPVLIVERAEDADAQLHDGPNNTIMPQGDVDGDGFEDWVDFGQLVYGGPRPTQGPAIDSEYGPFFRIAGVARFGTRAVRHGDVNGDGYSDLLVESARGYFPPALGSLSAEELAAENERKDEFLQAVAAMPAFLWYGGPERGCCKQVLDEVAAGFKMTDDLTAPLRTALLERPDAEVRGDYRIGAQALGDIDGDGFDDLAVTASLARTIRKYPLSFTQPPDSSTESMTYLYYGQRERFEVGVQREPDARLAGVHLEPLGDLNGDGYDDFQAMTAGGSSYVIGGSAERLPARPELGAISVPLLAGQDVVEVNALGDIDGDGFDDLSMANYLVYGSSSLLQGPIDPSASSAEIVTEYGVRGAGDWNGDGKSDLLILQAVPEGPRGIREGISVIAGTSRRFSGRQVVPPYVPTGTDGGVGTHMLGDADGDGRADLFFQGAVDEKLKWLVKYGGPLTTSIH